MNARSNKHNFLPSSYLYASFLMVRKTFKYRLYPTKAQASKFGAILEECRWLYNKMLEEHKYTWEVEQKVIGLYDQHARLPALKSARPSLETAHSQVLQNVCLRLDLAFKAFFRRVKAGEAPGHPRFKSFGRYDSFTFPQAPSGCQLRGEKLVVSKVGPVKIVLHRPVEGVVKTATIRRTATGKWFAFFSCELEPKPLPTSTERAGIDVGLMTFATLSNGEKIENPRFFRREEKALAQAQRKLSATPKGTPKRVKLRKAVARVHERSTNRRHDFIHQQSRRLVNRFGLIAVEDLNVNRMGRERKFSKSIHDAAWSMFFACLSFKAEEAGRTMVAVNPAYTSQDCSRCGQRQLMPLAERVYRCPSCGLELDRDHNASLNILAVGLHGLGLP